MKLTSFYIQVLVFLGLCMCSNLTKEMAFVEQWQGSSSRAGCSRQLRLFAFKNFTEAKM